MSRQILVFTILFTLTACDAPPVSAGADKRQNTYSARIDGHVVVSSVARGNVVLFLFDAARPPPPLGTGRPLTFTVVSKDALFGTASAQDTGPFTAPFSFSLVGAGRYLIRGFIDANADFVPWYRVTNEVHTGDVGGAALTPTFTSRVIDVTLDENQHPLAVLDVPVSFADTARVPVDRPVFEASGTSVTLGANPVSIDLRPKAISTGAVHQPSPVFLARLVDDNGDGVPDDANGDGVPDFWPRVVVRKVSSTDVLIDENDRDDNGLLEATPGFADYEHVNPVSKATIAADGQPDLVVLAAGFDFTSLLPQLLDAEGKVKLTPTPVPSLKLVIQPQALDASDPTKLGFLKSVPAGRYAITLIQSTGQTWRVPNEMSPEVAEGLGLPPIVSQSFVVVVQ